MEAIQKVIETLDGNQKISVEVKKEMLSLISEFHSRFPGISLETLCNNLRRLSIEKGSKFAYTSAINYSPIDSKIFINEEMLNREEVDVYHSMMKAIIEMVASKRVTVSKEQTVEATPEEEEMFLMSVMPRLKAGESASDIQKEADTILEPTKKVENEECFCCGFHRYSRLHPYPLEALNAGFCEIIANNLVGNEGESQFLDEQILVNYIGSSIGFDIFQKAFFENNPELLMKELLTKCSNPEKLNNLLRQANNNMHTRRKSGESRLYHIQSQALSMFEVDKNFHFQRAALQDGSTKYIDYEELDELIKEQTIEWTRGK